MSLKGHTALITGAGQGIGKACSLVFASKNANLVLLDKNPDTLSQVTGVIEEMGCRAAGHVLDLNNLDRLTDIVKQSLKTRLIDILINNAGFDRPGTTATLDKEDFEDVMAIHLIVPLLLVKLLLPGMRTAGWGRIINVGSIYGLIGEKGELAYSTAKAGIIGFTKSVAKECGRDGVTVNAVLPGLTRTPTIERFMAERYKNIIIENTPLKRIAEPEEVANVIEFLASDKASFVTGITLPVSGGWGI